MNVRVMCAGALVVVCAGAAVAQEAMYTASGTMPSPGTFWLRTQPHYFQYGSSPVNGTDRTDRYELMNTVAYGLDRGVAIYVDVPFEHSSERDGATGDRDSHDGVDELNAMVKWRVYRHDSGGVDTLRAVLMGGLMTEFEDQAHVDPMVGGALTRVMGRHGFNQDLFYRLTTGGTESANLGGEGPADAVLFNSAYVFRVAPSQYTSETVGAWYVTAEVNGMYETNGDTELRWSPGLMYEGRKVGLEIMAQFPLWNDVDHRAELDFGIGVGFRVVF